MRALDVILIGASPEMDLLRRRCLNAGFEVRHAASHLRGVRRDLVVAEPASVSVVISNDSATRCRFGADIEQLIGDAVGIAGIGTTVALHSGSTATGTIECDPRRRLEFESDRLRWDTASHGVSGTISGLWPIGCDLIATDAGDAFRLLTTWAASASRDRRDRTSGRSLWPDSGPIWAEDAYATGD